MRTLTPELMDDPAVDPAEHRRALAGLRRLNLASRAAASVWNALLPIACPGGTHRGRTHQAGECSVLDIATGSGDLLIALARRARARGLHLDLHAADISPLAIETARAAANRAGVRVELFHMDVIRDPIPGTYDAVICSLFMHHLTDEQAVTVLYKMRSAARRVVIVSDLARARTSAALAWLGSRLLTRSAIVRTDAMRSVAAAYTAAEFAEVAARAGLVGGRFRAHVPARFVFTWERPR
ncbi:MAG: methyltransferase domain-containing protein [Phycisphaerales bacterium]